MKVVVNRCYGGFGLSEEAVRKYFECKGWEFHMWGDGYTTHYATKPFTPVENPKHPWKAFTYEEGSYFNERDIERDDPDLVAVVEELGAEADGAHANLSVVEIPDDVEWEIEEYDGTEWVSEKHRTW